MGENTKAFTTPQKIPKITMWHPLPEELKIEHPELLTWKATSPEQEYFTYDNGLTYAKFEEYCGLSPGTSLSTFLIIKPHFKSRMADILRHINYFCHYYDIEGEYFFAVFSIKYIIDQKPNLSLKAFKNLVIDRIVTPSFVNKIKFMTMNLYTFDLGTNDEETRFKSTPKITNQHARMINAFSFAIRCLIPICLHYSNINKKYAFPTGYIEVFDKVYCAALKQLEKDDVEIYDAIYRFIEYRVERSVASDKGTWIQKKQLHGIAPELYLDDLHHQVIFVKNLHKLDYTQSCVSYLNSIIQLYNKNFKQENYTWKPYEIEMVSDDDSSNDDYLSHAESIEMSAYKLDESHNIISEVNVDVCMREIRKQFPFGISQGEFEFYMQNVKLNFATEFLLHVFYSKKFGSSSSIYILNRPCTIELLLYLKKFLSMKGMILLPQICTAKVNARNRHSILKNTKLLERLESSPIWKHIIEEKFVYLNELESRTKKPEERIIVKKLEALINSIYEFVDMDSDINELEYSDVDVDLFVHEFLAFLSII